MATVLQVKERKEFRHSFLTSIRQEGNVPAVVYGKKMESKSIFFSEADFIKTIKEVGRNGVFSLDLDGKKHDVVLTDYQANPLKNNIVHADFLSIDKTTELTADVTVNLVGDAPGVKEGGVLQQSFHEVSVTATADKIPQSIDVDISKLQVGDNLTIADLKSASSYIINHEEDEVLLSILPPRVEEVVDSGEVQGSQETDAKEKEE
ncbi:50S ribosomal protein L25/general stress protein Ctc [Cytobacillus purgationiresistens]|uniref:Large ribosomal subunit protein bL25 n=1 Tax=Cytobacillus purgationiresistens TaxID=863449 RepID=A0ABU0AP84_9BACI|nr:50S ribosomal protein L25/general stress protein Ctc [Cytobacillus purgationiresistens]MDQ0273099.1 large subunit ribosomal protein L25 [Cytobacillus purgationiresistens]